MLNRFTIFALLFIPWHSPSATANNLNTEIFIHTESISYSQVAPIKQFADSLQGPAIDRGDKAFTSNSLALGQRVDLPRFGGAIEYAFVTRIDYSLRFSHDTAILFYTKENDIALNGEAIHDVYLDANHIRANGLRLGYIGDWNNSVEYRLHLAYLNADNMLYGKMEGDLTSLENDAKGTLHLDYHYSEDVFFERLPSDLHGDGFTLDIGVTWKVTSRATLDFTARDIVSEITWDEQHQTIANASSNRVNADEQGAIRVSPILTWRETSSTVEQSLPRQFSLFGNYRFSASHAMMLEHFVYDGHDFQRLGYRYHLNERYHISALYDLTAEAYTIEAGLPYLSIGVQMDDMDLEHAKLFGFFVTVKAPLQF